MTVSSTSRWLLTLAALAVLTECALVAQRAESPADATVFIRLVGSVHADIDDGLTRQAADLERVELGTGSGFVISPHGYVLTNEHVISNREFTVNDGLRTTKLTLTVSRIDVCFAAAASRLDATPSCLEASVHSSDASLDLAVLFVSGANLPYVALGDSDAVTAAQDVEAFGYPFGRQLEVGRTAAPDLVPAVSVSAGTISSLRSDDVSERRVIQVNAAINPGNSGGPLVDRDGYAVGVIRARVVGDAGIGFAIPINLAKDFLESNGLDALMPVRRLRLGAFQEIDGKELGLRLPVGIVDVSPYRARVENDASGDDAAVRIDRGYSLLSARQIEQMLVGTDAFERVSVARNDSRLVSRSSGGSMILGRAIGSSGATAEEMRMAYGILDLGDEMLVARFIGPPDQLAYNESVIVDSLLSLDGREINAPTVPQADGLQWSSVPATANGVELPIPAGWIVEPGGPSPCDQPPARKSFAAYPSRAIAVSLRAALWDSAAVELERVALDCARARGSLGPSSYRLSAEWLGVSYAIEGLFVRVGPNYVAQLEVIAPVEKQLFARDLLAAWIKHTATSSTPSR